MVKMVFGSNGGQSFVKIMRNAGDDPITTPDTDYGKFLFNSNNQNLGYVLGIKNDYYNNPAWTWGGPSQERSGRIPSGSSWGDAQVYWYTKQQSNVNYFLNWYLLTRNVYGDFGDNDFAPLMDYKVVGLNGAGRWTGASTGYAGYFSPGGGTYESGFWYTSVSGHASGYDSQSNLIVYNAIDTIGGSNLVNPTGSTLRGTSTTSPNAFLVPYNYKAGTKWNVSVWDIPGNNMPMNPASPTPVAGQEVVRLNPTGMKMARKGFTVDDADTRRFIINTNRIPAKIMRTGVITLGANSFTDITTPLPVNDNCAVDMMVKGESGQFLYPPMLTVPTGGVVYQVVYEFVGSNTVRIRNLSTLSVEISYIILADDGAPQTTGGSKVFRQEPGYVQIKKPGSSDTAPALSDIVLDTRLASLTVAAEGYIPHTDMTETPTKGYYGNLAKSVYFTGSDGSWRPFVKYTTVYDVGSGKTGYKLPQTRFFFTNRTSPYVLMPARQSSVAEIYDNRVKFHLTRNNPYAVYANENGSWSTNNHGEPNPIGIRYYIFAIPNTL